MNDPDVAAADPHPTHGAISKLETQTRNPHRISVYLDGEFAFGLHREVVIRHALSIGMTIDEAMVRRSGSG